VAAGLICKLKLPPGVKHPFVAQIVMPRKKDAEGNWTERCVCEDYRPHNDKTVPDKYPMPIADELFDDLGGSDRFSTLDLRMGYLQIRIREGDQYKLAFWGHDDIYMPLRTPFGPKNAPALFQRLMDEVPKELRVVARAFIDDTIVHTKGFQVHLAALRAVFEKLRLYKIKVHPKKICIQEVFPEIAFFGYMVNPIGLKPQEVKVAAIMRIPYPTSVTALKQLMGIINYHRKFLKGCSMIARPLNDLLKKDVDLPAELLTEHKGAIDKLKEMLCSAPLLVRPDPNREFELHTDWSAAGCGAILQQRGKAGEERVISHASCSNNKPESNYSSYAGECLASVWGVRYHRVYLYGRRFLLYIDHRPLEWLMTSQTLTGMHARWALTLQEFDFEVKYRKGLVNMNANGLSRNPQPETEDLAGAREHDDLPGELVVRDPEPVASVMLATLGSGRLARGGGAPQRGRGWGGVMGTRRARRAREPGFSRQHRLRSTRRRVACASGAGTRRERARALTDIWEDEHSLRFLRDDGLDPVWPEKEHERVQRRCRSYRFVDGVLIRTMTDGEDKVVGPAPAQRPNLVKEVHNFTGHWGEKRTVHLLKKTYWWAGMYDAAQKGVAECQQCDRAKASFAVKMTGMQSLPIMGLGYRRSLDFASPLVTTRSNKRFVLIGIEHFSKWCEVWALPSKLSARVAEAFLGVMTRYGACAELLTDNGQEFAGELDVLCQKLLITHRTTSRYQLQSNGGGCMVRCTTSGENGVKVVLCFGKFDAMRCWDDQRHVPNDQNQKKLFQNLESCVFSTVFSMLQRQTLI
jgi:hypothetical protein